MRKRDWAGTILVTCLIAAAGLLRDHTLLLGLLAVAAAACIVVIAWDVFTSAQRVRAALAESCSRQAQRIEDYMLDRETNDPRNQHHHSLSSDERTRQEQTQSAYWHETGRLFQHRLGSETRRLLEALQDQGLLASDRLQKMEIIRVSKANPGEIHELGHVLRSGAQALRAEA